MNTQLKYFVLIATTFLFLVTPLHAGDFVDNPRYSLWANFKVGSSATLSVDMDIDNVRTHFDITRKLISVTPDQVEVEISTVNTTKGTAPSTVTSTIPAKAAISDIKEGGNRQIIAMGKTFKCKVWDATGEDVNDKTHSGMGDLAGGTKAVIYISPEVPGGIVERDAVNQDGKQMNYVLTAMDVKQ